MQVRKADISLKKKEIKKNINHSKYKKSILSASEDTQGRFSFKCIKPYSFCQKSHVRPLSRF